MEPAASEKKYLKKILFKKKKEKKLKKTVSCKEIVYGPGRNPNVSLSLYG